VLYDLPFKLIQTSTTLNNNVLAFGGLFLDITSERAGAEADNMIVAGITPLGLTADIIRFDPYQAAGTGMSVTNVDTGDDAIAVFDTTTGAVSGSFPSTSDDAYASNSITVVADDGSGNAVFTVVGSPPKENSTITIIGFTTNTDYNGTWFAVNISGSTFEASTGVNQVQFGTNEAGGSVSAVGMLVTSTGHGLVEGNTVYLDTQFSTDYDGGFKIYDVQTNFFFIAATFIATEAGTWSTAGRDQTDPRVLADLNRHQQSSKYIAAGGVDANVIDVGTITNGVYKECVFGSAGTALEPGSTIERFKLIDEIEGEFEYTGEEPFSGRITFDFTVLSSGGSQDFLFKWRKDTGSGFVNLVDDFEALVNVGSAARGVSKTFALTMDTGDVIKPFVTRDAGTSALTITYATIFANQ